MRWARDKKEIHLFDQLLKSLQSKQVGQQMTIDFAGIDLRDSRIQAKLFMLLKEVHQQSVPVTFAHLDEQQRSILECYPKHLVVSDQKEQYETSLGFFAWVGRTSINVFSAASVVIRLVLNIIYYGFLGVIRVAPLRPRYVLHEMVLIGYGAVAIVFLISLLVGIVLALNGAYQLRQFGALIYVADLVGIAVTREIGPLMVAIIIAGRSGSAIAAQIGTMVVTEEIDAMRTMALSPVRYVYLPKIIALAVMGPCLEVLGVFAGVFGGYVVGAFALGIGSDNYIRETTQALFINDIVVGMFKSFVYAVTIGIIAIYQGIQVKKGAEEIGLAATNSVVYSIIWVVVLNSLFSYVFYVFQ